MTRFALGLSIAVAMASVCGSAAAQDALNTLDYSTLQQDWEANAVLNGDVYTQAGTEVGEVADLVIGPAELVQKVVVETGGPTGDGSSFYAVNWSEAIFDPNYHSVTIEMNLDQIKELERKEQIGAFAGDKEMLADRVIGMNVNLSGENPSAEVEDLLLDTSEQVTAMIVEGNDLEGKVRAVPFNPAWIDLENRLVTLPFSGDEFEDIDLYEYDAIAG